MNDNKQARLLDEQAAQRRARIIGISYFDTSRQELPLYKEVLPIDEMKSLRIIPLYATSNEIRFGITNTTSQNTIRQLAARFQEQQIQIYLISDTGFRELINRYDPPKQVVYKDISLRSDADENQTGNISSTLNIIRADDMLAYIVKQAFMLKASDIHLETDINDIGIRLRVDGVLHPIARLSWEKYMQLMSSIASSANVSTSSSDAQTGHINKNYSLADGSQVEVNLRVETVPTAHGMDVVLRLFNLDPDMMRLDRLGMLEHEFKIFKDIIKRPTGLLLIVGPTGSGKTTTMYSIINELNTPERKLITLEDPIEYNIKGVTQIPVDSRKDENGFADKFRAVLRLDPDCIMVGEIRDSDTAKTALQSALTGHLVLSTYHASSASTAITRMLGSVEENPLFASAIRLIQAQRLVRRLDDSTKEAFRPDEATKRWLKSVVDTMPDSIERPSLDNITLYRPVPSVENPFGYSGQFAVRELMLMTPSIEEELQKPIHTIAAHRLQELAVEDGMSTMLHEGVLRVLAGETTLSEISRTIV